MYIYIDVYITYYTVYLVYEALDRLPLTHPPLKGPPLVRIVMMVDLVFGFRVSRACELIGLDSWESQQGPGS